MGKVPQGCFGRAEGEAGVKQRWQAGSWPWLGQYETSAHLPRHLAGGKWEGGVEKMDAELHFSTTVPEGTAVRLEVNKYRLQGRRLIYPP